MNETLELIQRLADERSALYRLGGRGGFSPEQERRLNEINGQLPQLWDNYRRELAADRRPAKQKSPYDFDAA